MPPSSTRAVVPPGMRASVSRNSSSDVAGGSPGRFALVEVSGASSRSSSTRNASSGVSRNATAPLALRTCTG